MDYHDVLAEVGAGSAHPGGMDSTALWMSHVALDHASRVLDVGCGTGRTLLLLNEIYGCEIAGVDVRPAMVKKARIRAKRRGVEADIRVGTAENLPFKDDSFDLVVTESVNVFVNLPKALSEYYRVLKPGGRFIDVEMMVMQPVTREWKESVKAVYGALQVPDLGGWKRAYRDAGFADIRVLASRSIQPMDIANAQGDEMDLTTPGAFQKPSVLAVLQANSAWMENNYRTIGYGVFLVTKPNEV